MKRDSVGRYSIYGRRRNGTPAPIERRLICLLYVRYIMRRQRRVNRCRVPSYKPYARNARGMHASAAGARSVSACWVRQAVAQGYMHVASGMLSEQKRRCQRRGCRLPAAGGMPVPLCYARPGRRARPQQRYRRAGAWGF